MKISTVTTVLIASFAFVAGAAIERHTRETAAPATTTATHASTHKIAPERVTTLVTLPEVTVRPSAEDIALAYAQPVADIGAVSDVDHGVPDSPIRRSAGKGGFDMPYYSFGKVLPQVSQD
ncbi:MAG TPA: hypothetical protein VN153_00575 [Tahibacter sp.]|nr:hypothetical protein [Tahibacter sp.]